jgi:predicted GNAT family acetyltransferase
MSGLEEVLEAEPKVEYIVESPEAKSIKVSLPENCYLYGSLPTDKSDKTAWIGTTFVNPKYHKHGIAQKLFRTYLQEVKDKGFEKVAGYSTNYNAFKSLLKVVDAENIEVKDLKTGDIVDMEVYKQNPERNFQIWINLNNLNF